MSIDGVVARLTEVQRGLPDTDGVRWFNLLYLRVTERVQGCLASGGFEDPAFMERLDVVFADLYLEALAGAAARPWGPLLSARADAGIAPERFMLAGINAHVNYDLPIALVRTCRQTGGELECATARHRDFLRIDDILAEVEAEMHHRLHTSHVEEVVALWAVVRSRDRAWTTAMKLAGVAAGAPRDGLLGDLADLVADWGDLLLHLPG